VPSGSSLLKADADRCERGRKLKTSDQVLEASTTVVGVCRDADLIEEDEPRLFVTCFTSGLRGVC